MSVLGEIPYETFQIILNHSDNVCLGRLREVNKAAASNQQLVRIIADNTTIDYLCQTDASTKLYGLL